VKATSRSGRSLEGAESVVLDFDDARTFAVASEDVDRANAMQPTGYVQTKTLVPVVEVLAARKIKVVLQSVFDLDADNTSLSTGAAGVGALGYCLRNSSPNWRADDFHATESGIDYGQTAVPAAGGKSSFIDVRDARQIAGRQILEGAPSFVDVSLTPRLKPTSFETYVVSLTLFATQLRSA
jgi:hypothetical protein